jgi:hypothetical protein
MGQETNRKNLRNETKRNETKRNETKRNETKRNETKRNENKKYLGPRNETKGANDPLNLQFNNQQWLVYPLSKSYPCV